MECRAVSSNFFEWCSGRETFVMLVLKYQDWVSGSRRAVFDVTSLAVAGRQGFYWFQSHSNLHRTGNSISTSEARDFRIEGGEGEIVKSSERGGNGDWGMRGGLFHLTSFSYSSPDSMSGINQIVSLLKSDHFERPWRELGGLNLYIGGSLYWWMLQPA